MICVFTLNSERIEHESYVCIAGMLGVRGEKLFGYLAPAFLKVFAESIDVDFNGNIFSVSGMCVAGATESGEKYSRKA